MAFSDWLIQTIVVLIHPARCLCVLSEKPAIFCHVASHLLSNFDLFNLTTPNFSCFITRYPLVGTAQGVCSISRGIVIMKAVFVCVLLVFVFSCFAAADEAAHKAHVHEDKLADAEHYVDGEHNPDHDHEAFLGGEKDEFDHLSPDEAKKRLRNLIKKVDSDKDEAITTEELTDWVKKVFHERSLVGVDKDVEEKDTDKNGKVDWNEYVKGTYGDTGDDDEEVKELLQRDRRRFDAADKDKDGALDKREFGTFLHPESSPEMGDIHVTETIEGELLFSQIFPFFFLPKLELTGAKNHQLRKSPKKWKNVLEVLKYTSLFMP